MYLIFWYTNFALYIFITTSLRCHFFPPGNQIKSNLEVKLHNICVRRKTSVISWHWKIKTNKQRTKTKTHFKLGTPFFKIDWRHLTLKLLIFRLRTIQHKFGNSRLIKILSTSMLCTFHKFLFLFQVISRQLLLSGC